VTPVAAEHLFGQLCSVGEIAVVRQRDAEGRVHVKGLRLLRIGSRTCSGIANMRDTRGARERSHVAGAEYIPHQSVGLVETEFFV